MNSESLSAHRYWFQLDEPIQYRTDKERRFLEALFPHAHRKWGADAWLHDDHLAISVVLPHPTGNAVRRTLRVDFYGSKILVGDDDSHQLVNPLSETTPSVSAVESESPEELAQMAADLISQRILEDAAEQGAPNKPLKNDARKNARAS